MNNEQYEKIEEGEIRIIVPHLNSELTCIYPFFGPDTYFVLAKEIEKRGLQKPNMSQTASLVKYGFKNNDKYSEEIKKIMKNNIFYVFNGILYLPEKGIFFEDDPKFKEGSTTADNLIMNEKDLESKLGTKEEKGIIYSDDGNVRFLKDYNFQIENQSSFKLSKNPFVIALAGEEGTEKLAYIADEYKNKPFLFALKNVTQSKKRVAALDSDRDRLDLNGDNLGDYRGGSSFGVRA